MKRQELLCGFRNLRQQIKTQTKVDAREGLERRQLIFQARAASNLRDVVLSVEAGLDSFERSLIEKRDRYAVEAARTSFLAALDSMIRRLSA